MFHLDIDGSRDVFVYAMIEGYLKTCNHATATGLSASGEPPKLTKEELLFVFLIAQINLLNKNVNFK